MKLKPGTRCECRDHHGADENPQPYTGAKYIHGLTWPTLGGDLQCPRDAVRLVTVTDSIRLGEHVPMCYRLGEHVPMCRACSDYHNAKK
jgi:hypothetical protein